MLRLDGTTWTRIISKWGLGIQMRLNERQSRKQNRPQISCTWTLSHQIYLASVNNELVVLLRLVVCWTWLPESNTRRNKIFLGVQINFKNFATYEVVIDTYQECHLAKKGGTIDQI